MSFSSVLGLRENIKLEKYMFKMALFCHWLHAHWHSHVQILFAAVRKIGEGLQVLVDELSPPLLQLLLYWVLHSYMPSVVYSWEYSLSVHCSTYIFVTSISDMPPMTCEELKATLSVLIFVLSSSLFQLPWVGFSVCQFLVINTNGHCTKLWLNSW